MDKSFSLVPLETNVHFPAGLNLLWDINRKCLDTIERLHAITPVNSWRKIKYIRKNLKSEFRRTSHQVFKGKIEQAKEQSVKQYLQLAQALKLKCEALLQTPALGTDKETMALILHIELRNYVAYAHKFIGQIERRQLKVRRYQPKKKCTPFLSHTPSG